MRVTKWGVNTECLIAKPIDKRDDNICCNHVVVPDLVPIVYSTSKDKSVYVPSQKKKKSKDGEKDC